MGGIIGGIVGGIGSLLAGKQAAKADQQAAQTALTGYNYLAQNPYALQQEQTGSQAASQQAALLGVGGDTAAANQGFQNYLNSTGYKFQLGQGMDAITGSQAAKGLLDSGDTLKALNNYGQGMAGQAFQNYLGNLGNVASNGNQFITQTGQAGSGYGAAMGSRAQVQAGQDQGSGITNFLGGLTSAGNYGLYAAGINPYTYQPYANNNG